MLKSSKTKTTCSSQKLEALKKARQVSLNNKKNKTYENAYQAGYEAGVSATSKLYELKIEEQNVNHKRIAKMLVTKATNNLKLELENNFNNKYNKITKKLNDLTILLNKQKKNLFDMTMNYNKIMDEINIFQECNKKVQNYCEDCLWRVSNGFVKVYFYVYFYVYLYVLDYYYYYICIMDKYVYNLYIWTDLI